LFRILRTFGTFSDNCISNIQFIVDRICKNQNMENDFSLLGMKKEEKLS